MQDNSENPAPKSKKKLILGVSAALLFILGGVGAYIFLKPQSSDPKEELLKKEEVDTAPNYVDIAPITTTLHDENGSHQIRVKILLEVEKMEQIADVEQSMPRIMNAANTYIQTLNAEDLVGSSGNHKIQVGLMGAIAPIVPNVHIERILIQNIVIQ